MALKVEWTRFGVAGEHLGYLAWPARAQGPLPGVIVLQEAWGVDDHIEDVTRRFAGAGYVAFAPDLFSVGGGRPAPLTRDRLTAYREFMDGLPRTAWMDQAQRQAALDALPAAERAPLSETLAALGIGSGPKLEQRRKIVLTAARHLRRDCPASRGQKIGAVGFCMGGGFAALLACDDPDLAASVIFYGTAPPAEALPAIRCPVLGFYGGLDARITGAVPAFAEAMKTAGKRFEPHVYPGAAHAFFNDGRPSYDAAAARDAFVRTLAFLGAELAAPAAK
jgi:carboxymethylenebutenolidase